MTPSEAKYKHEHYIEGKIFEAFKDVNRDIQEALIINPNGIKIDISRFPSVYCLDTNVRKALLERLKSEWEKDGWYCYTYYGHIFEIKSQPKSASFIEKLKKLWRQLWADGFLAKMDDEDIFQ